ncbi:MAG: hypothetical protein HQM07_05860 [Zetaproteobacteria bacterium]|nr:hypothetical protein [Zetaproteobacteria bacterium]
MPNNQARAISELTSLKAEQQRSWGPKWLRGLVAFAVGALLLDSAFSALDVRIEWFFGISTFGMNWVIAMTVVPIAVGVVIGFIYGFGGKYLAHFPPVLTLGWAYYESVQHISEMPIGVHLIPWPLWAFYLILQMEFCAGGGVIGELLMRRYLGWDSQPVHRADSSHFEEDEDVASKQ